MDEKYLCNLDDPRIYTRYDPAGMLGHIHNFPSLCEQAWQMAMDLTLPPDYSNVDKVVVLGMGGSAIGGDLVSSLGISECRLPILVCRDYQLPAYVDERTLVIASSYSGTTEETLSAFQQAFKTPAKKLAITTGGKLRALCAEKGVPVFTFDYKTQPRAALPFSFFIFLGIMQRLDILKDKSVEVSEVLFKLPEVASRINEEVPTLQNPAKALAQKLSDRLVIIYGAGITAEVAHRWKTQINENAKTMSFHEVFSELNHNSVVGFRLPQQLARQTMVVFLYSHLLPERIRRRYEITQTLLGRAGSHYYVVAGEGESGLCQMLSLVLFGDYVSVYLAMLNRVDPTPVQPIDYLKQELANGEPPLPTPES